MKLYLTGEPCTQQRHCYFVEGETASFIMDCGYQRCYRGDELPHLLPEQIRAARSLLLSLRTKTNPARCRICSPTASPGAWC